MRLAGVLSVLALTLALVLPWALDPAGWGAALRYRAWYVILVAPLVAMAVVDALRRSPWRDRRIVLVAAPVVMTATLVALGVSWIGLQTRLADTLAASPTAFSSGRPSLGSTALRSTTGRSRASDSSSRGTTRPTWRFRIGRARPVGAGGIVVKETPFDRDVRPVNGWWR